MRTSPYGVWFSPPRPNPGAAVRLVCVPYAGGGAMVYREWAEALPPEIEVVPVQLPGREWRVREEPISRMDRMVAVLVRELDRLADRPLALFGHSMGALIAFEVARSLHRVAGPPPVHLLVAGHSAPQLGGRRRRPARDSSDEAFVAMLRELSGTPPEVLDNPELMELLLPALRADFDLCETYEYSEGQPLECPITALAGIADPLVPPERMERWKEQTTAAFALRVLPGGHFFLNESNDLVLRAVVHALFSR